MTGWTFPAMANAAGSWTDDLSPAAASGLAFAAERTKVAAPLSVRPLSFMLPRLLALLLAALLFPLASCSREGDEQPVVVTIIGERAQIREPLTYNESVAGQVMLAATARGLVAMDENGEVVPALAQRWIVVDAGRSYIFRLRRARWADGKRIDAREVARLLETRIRATARLDPLGNLAAVREVRAMTADVIEVQLESPRPNFLIMLAQPQLAIARASGGTGPYTRERKGDFMLLRPVPMGGRAAEDEDALRPRDERMVYAERAAKAVVRFREGRADLLLGGTLAEYPFVSLAGIERRAIRLDPVQGLFGLAFVRRNALTGDAAMRAALAMSVDRAALPALFELAGWQTSERILPQQLNMALAPSDAPWSALPREERLARASGIVTRWRAGHDGKAARIAVSVPDQPGARLLFHALKRDWRAIGVEAQLAKGGDADLVLVDRVAPYDSAFWYLSQISCRRGVECDPAMEEALREAAATDDMTLRAAKLSEAEALAVAYNGFVPLAVPVRWSLVSRRLTGFSPTARGWHTLDRLID